MRRWRRSDGIGIGLLLGIRRAKYAGVLTWQGRWDEAESDVTRAVEGLAAARPPLVGEALVRLAALRRLQGRYDDADALLARCSGDTRTLLVQSQLALDRGRLTEAAELAERFLRRRAGPHRLERAEAASAEAMLPSRAAASLAARHGLV